MHNDYVATADMNENETETETETETTPQHEELSLSVSRRVALGVKRLMDIFGSVVGLVLLSPLMLFVMWKIKHDDPGPALFANVRYVKDGRTVLVWKFRTMVLDADNILERVLNSDPRLKKEWEKSRKLSNDPRVTKFGLFLRRTSIDELPQLWNVLKGDLSLVGPRPIYEDEIERYGRFYETRKKIQPGVTGMWQISGRGDTSYAERVALDKWYIENWSLWLDVKIILKTAWVVLSGRGAY